MEHMQSGTTRGWVSGLDLLQAEQTAWRCISSGCASIDQILGGGIRSHEITEFCTFLVPCHAPYWSWVCARIALCSMHGHQQEGGDAGGMPGSGKTQLG